MDKSKVPRFWPTM